jgi:hypothetical protein
MGRFSSGNGAIKTKVDMTAKSDKSPDVRALAIKIFASDILGSNRKPLLLVMRILLQQISYLLLLKIFLLKMPHLHKDSLKQYLLVLLNLI